MRGVLRKRARGRRWKKIPEKIGASSGAKSRRFARGVSTSRPDYVDRRSARNVDRRACRQNQASGKQVTVTQHANGWWWLVVVGGGSWWFMVVVIAVFVVEVVVVVVVVVALGFHVRRRFLCFSLFCFLYVHVCMCFFAFTLNCFYVCLFSFRFDFMLRFKHVAGG